MERKEATCMAEDYGDILLKAVKTVVDGVVEGLQFDKTVICKTAVHKRFWLLFRKKIFKISY